MWIRFHWMTLAVAFAACRPSVSHRTDPESGPRDAAIVDAGDAASDASSDVGPSPAFAPRCPTRSLPPEELSIGAAPGAGTSVIWNGSEWGVVWSEIVTDEPAVFFARVGRDGHRIGNPVRVSERGYRASSAALLWNHDGWTVAFSGGASRLEEIWMGVIDARGTSVGRPHRVTARNRRDLSPALGFNGHDLVAVWATQLPDNHYGILAVRMDRWGAQLGAPIIVADRRERLSAPSIVWNGFAWAVAWLVSRTEAIAVDMARLEPDVSRTRGYSARVTLGPLGGTDQSARFGIAWDSANYALVWDEVRDGAPHVFFDSVNHLLEPGATPSMLSLRADSAIAPAIAALGAGTFFAAWEVERGRERHVQLATFDLAANPLGERIEVQSNDGRASMPALAIGDDAVGLATVSTRGVTFHRVLLGPCARQ